MSFPVGVMPAPFLAGLTDEARAHPIPARKNAPESPRRVVLRKQQLSGLGSIRCLYLKEPISGEFAGENWGSGQI